MKDDDTVVNFPVGGPGPEEEEGTEPYQGFQKYQGPLAPEGKGKRKNKKPSAREISLLRAKETATRAQVRPRTTKKAKERSERIESRTPGKIRSTIAQMRLRQEPIWKQLICESDAVYGHFSVYRDMGPQRSLKAVCQVAHHDPDRIVTDVSGYFRNMSIKYQWRDRAKAFDNWIEDSKEESLQRKMDEAALVWATRQVKLRDDGWELGSHMLTLARMNIDKALGIVRDKDGQFKSIEPETCEPLVFKPTELAQFIKAAMLILQEAVAPAKSRNDGEQTAIQGALTLPRDLHDASDDDLDSIIRQDEYAKRSQRAQIQ